MPLPAWAFKWDTPSPVTLMAPSMSESHLHSALGFLERNGKNIYNASVWPKQTQTHHRGVLAAEGGAVGAGEGGRNVAGPQGPPESREAACVPLPTVSLPCTH